MDKKSMGTFLTDLRKEKGLTQQEVADSLNVSNKTISKWERDEGYPEITMLPEIAKFYEITTDELLQGAKNEKLQDNVVIYKPEPDPKWSKLDKYALIANILSVGGLVLFVVFTIFIDFTGLGLNGLYLALTISTLSFAYLLYVILEKVKFKETVTLKNYNDMFFSFFFFGVEIFSALSFTVSENLGVCITPLFLVIPGVFLSIITTYLCHTLLNKIVKFSVITKEKRKLKKIFTSISCIFTAVAIVCVTAFSIYDFKTLKPFPHEVRFMEMYNTVESAQRDYQRLKNLIFNGEQLYILINEEGNTLYLNELVFTVEAGENGYNKRMFEQVETHLVFETEKGKQEFIKTSVIEDGKFDFLEQMDENIIFNDEKCSIKFNETESALDRARFHSGVYTVIGTGVTSLLYGLLALVYFKKKD